MQLTGQLLTNTTPPRQNKFHPAMTKIDLPPKPPTSLLDHHNSKDLHLSDVLFRSGGFEMTPSKRKSYDSEDEQGKVLEIRHITFSIV